MGKNILVTASPSLIGWYRGSPKFRLAEHDRFHAPDYGWFSYIRRFIEFYHRAEFTAALSFYMAVSPPRAIVSCRHRHRESYVAG